MKIILISALALSLSLVGCTPSRIKGGSVEHYATTGSKTFLNQGDDAKEPSKIDGGSESSTEFFIPSGSVVQLSTPQVSQPTPKTVLESPKTQSGAKATPSVQVPQVMSVVLSSNAVIKTFSKDSMKTVSGAAQKNVIGEIGAKLAAAKPIQFIGILVLLFGILSMWQPYLRALVNSSTTSLVLMVCGAAMIFGPMLVVGREGLILVVSGGVALGYFFIYRYGHTSAKAKILQQWIDKNQDGVQQPDELVSVPENKVETSDKKV